jgi:hypothetical protein
VGKKIGKKAGPRLGMGPAQIGGKRIIGEEGASSYVEVLQSEASSSATVRLGDPLGKDLPTGGNPLGKDLSDAQQMPTARGNDACPDGVAEKGVNLQQGKEMMLTLLGVWKSQLVRLQEEIGWLWGTFWKD